MSSLHDLTFAELEAALLRDGVKPVHALALWRALHREGVASWDEWRAAAHGEGQAALPPPLQRWAADNVGEPAAGARFTLDIPHPLADVSSDDGLSRKFLLRMQDGEAIETVLMGYAAHSESGDVHTVHNVYSVHLWSRHTACVSTQAGCAMGCVFCATGRGGFRRHLRAGEIVAQVRHCQRALRETAASLAGPAAPRLRNLVLMGMGEPLHNYDNVMRALEILTDPRAPHLSPRHISISTVGIVPGILRLARENRPYHLALSLHSVRDEERRALLPAARRWPLDELLAACRAYIAATGRRIFVEWTLIAGQNDSPAHARELAAALAGMDAHVNLIPLNPVAGYDGSPTHAAAAEAFKNILRQAGFPSTLRQRRGGDVDGGCGQLRGATRNGM